MALSLSLEDVKQCINMKEAIDCMEVAFKQLARDEVILPLRTAMPIKEEEGMSLCMPSYLPEQEALGLKVVSVFPKNRDKELPTIFGTILLLDAKTGELKAIMEGTYLTALRTGAVSGLATKYLSPERDCHLALIGAGGQAATQLQAVAAVRTIKKISIWSRNLESAEQFADTIKDHFEVEAHSELKQALKEADIICTATSSTEPLIHLNDIKPNAHINAIGSHTREMQEISADVLAKALIVVDQKKAALAEAGEIIAAVGSKTISKTNLKELGRLLLMKSTSTYKEKLTVFKSVGLAIQDISIAEAVYKNAVKNKLGTSFVL
ncbi:ornithine cyclodeaminase family protein [Legionella jordanis]|uniref:ornithine cyclodeaminase family protein n=1 Tax=Legionella jordanis TaxID=456 RepID=UPI000EFF9104|nr:ornithine cyclodeaminase family protein [Legionella jordanis]RMX20982.1 ornithine cyclodeaminase family protein [Legionella jordanis]HAT8713401.1 ornithine cyclodeaminase family protein [Legionella jordanis]